MEFNSTPAATTKLIFLFTDLEGSTRLWQQYPEAMKDILARHDEIVRMAVESSHGWVVKTTGDGFHAAFNAAEDGLIACIAAQRRLTAESWPETGPLRVRMGLHVGEAQERGGDYYGTAVNRAARLMSAANGGQVLLSAAVAGLLAGDLPEGATLKDLGEHRLKDLLRPERIYQLVHPQLLADFPALTSLTLLPNNLPAQPTLFVGRQTELGEINAHLTSAAVRLLTLTGPGGTGKTRLALQSGAELVDRFIDGTYFIDLAPIRDPNIVLVMIARTIGLRESSNGSMLEDLKGQLREKSMLLLLDNFEQVTKAAVHMAALLQYCPRLKLLATSREALHVRGEYLYPVPPLGLPAPGFRRYTLEELARFEAVQLFIERAQAVKPNFELTEENAAAIAELCLRLDGLPLAIELAAARLRLFSPEALRSRLGSRLQLLRGGARDLPERQQTLRDTIEWSYELLETAEKSLFKVLSVFSGGTFEAVEEVAAGIELLDKHEMDTVDGLGSLVDKSLIRLLDDGAGEAQLRMLETIREYAADRLKEDPDLQNAACRAHAVYYAAFAQRQWQRMAGYEREGAMAEMAASVENLQIAWRYWADEGNLEQLHKMVDALWTFYEGRGWYQAAAQLTTDLLHTLSTSPSSPEQARQEIMLQTSLARALLAIKGYTPEVEAAYARALQLSEGFGEIPQLFPVLRGLANYYQFRTDFDKAVQIGERILELAENNDDDQMRVHGYLVYGTSIGFLGSIQEGLAILEKGVALFDPQRQRLQPFQLGNNPGIVCLMATSFFLWWLGYPDRARGRAEKAITLAKELDHPFTLAYAHFHNGLLHLWLGEPQRTQEHALAMREIAEEYDYQLWNALSTILEGAAQAGLGRGEEGLVKLERGIELYLGHNSPPVFWPDLTGVRARVYGQAGKHAAGLSLINELAAQAGGEEIIDIISMLGLARAELLMAVAPGEAAALFRQILTVAQAEDVKLFALKAATMLCKLEMGDAQAEENVRILAEIYDSFTEGFGTADLIEARAAIEQWNEKQATGN